MKRILLAVCFVLASAVALAKPPTRTPRPHTPSIDAGADDAGSSSLTAPSVQDASISPTVVTPTDAGASENSARVSPLTPPAAEFPHGVDAGAPSFDYDRILSDVAALRARVAAATDLMFRSKLAIQVRTDGKYAKIARLNVAVDDGTVFTGKPGAKPEELMTVYEHAVAPGRHAVTVDIERADERDEGFRTAQKSRMIVDVPKDQRLNVEVILVDESTMGGDFPTDKNGRYDLRIRMRAVAKAAP